MAQSLYPLSFGLNNITTGQFPVTTTAAQLPNQPALYIILQAAKANTVPVYVGQAGVTDSTGLEIEAGGAPLVIPLANLNLLYAVASADVILSWMALY